MKRIKIGDIFELETSKGKCYLHYIYKDKLMGHLIRVLDGLHKNIPNDFSNIVNRPERYFTFFPLSAAVSQQIVKQVGNIPLVYEKPKFMRSKHIVRDDFIGWHIVNTDTLHRELVKELNEAQLKLSPFGISNDTIIVERMEQGWTLENWK